MRHIRRGGEYLRVADRTWRDPLSGEYARERGGCWNAPGSFGVVYLNGSVAVARAQVRDKLEPRGIRPEDLQADQGPVLVHTVVPEKQYVDAISADGLSAVGLSEAYPLDGRGVRVVHRVCQAIGQRAWDTGEAGIACRSAAGTAPPGSEELAFFARQALRPRKIESFADWF